LDISVGKNVATVNTQTSLKINSMKKNRHNAIINCGFQDGTVGLYSPNHVKGSVVTFQALREPINDIAIDNGGRYVACAGMGKKVGIYDLRNSYKPVCEHFLKGGSQRLTWSDAGVLASSHSNGEIMTYLDAHVGPIKQPYITFQATDQVQDIDFCPMEDVLGIGFNTGFESIIIPGAGKSSIDSYENNPFRTKKQLDNWEVSRLLDKIPAKMITLDSAELRRVAAVKKLDADQDKEDVKVENELEDESEGQEEEEVKEEVVESSEEEEDERLELAPVTLKKKMKGKSRTGHKELRKKQIRLEKVREHKNQLVENKMKNKKKIKKNKDLIVDEAGVKKRSALDRFR